MLKLCLSSIRVVSVYNIYIEFDPWYFVRKLPLVLFYLVHLQLSFIDFLIIGRHSEEI